jgi:hypothetical protein
MISPLPFSAVRNLRAIAVKNRLAPMGENTAKAGDQPCASD